MYDLLNTIQYITNGPSIHLKSPTIDPKLFHQNDQMLATAQFTKPNKKTPSAHHHQLRPKPKILTPSRARNRPSRIVGFVAPPSSIDGPPATNRAAETGKQHPGTIPRKVLPLESLQLNVPTAFELPAP